MDGVIRHKRHALWIQKAMGRESLTVSSRNAVSTSLIHTRRRDGKNAINEKPTAAKRFSGDSISPIIAWVLRSMRPAPLYPRTNAIAVPKSPLLLKRRYVPTSPRTRLRGDYPSRDRVEV